jgi:general secretion pathway protein I
MRPRTKSAAGFTLLEAIVALAIIGSALIPLVAFISQASNQLLRAADENERSFAKQAAVALLESANPMTDPKGAISIDANISLTWDSEAIVAPNDGPLVGGGLAGFRLGFYKMHVQMIRADSGPWFAFDLRKTGYERFQGLLPFGAELPASK